MRSGFHLHVTGYGCDIYVGNRVLFNFNCVLLDMMPIWIGGGAVISPGITIGDRTIGETETVEP